jgi:FtsZ-interacting cell division protein ZipA
MTRIIVGELVIVALFVVGAYYSFRWMFRSADKKAADAIAADADGTIAASRKNLKEKTK